MSKIYVDHVIKGGADSGSHDGYERGVLVAEDAGAAKRAVGMRPQPNIYTVDVENMATNRKCADVIIDFKL